MATGRSKASPDETPSESSLLKAATALVAQEGFAGLTLRPLAAALGVSVSYLTNRYGSREGILAQVLLEAAADDRKDLLLWARLRDEIRMNAGQTLADLAETVLDHLATTRRDLSVLFLECVQASGWDAHVRDALADWRQVRADFWNSLARRACVPEDVIASGLVEGYFVDELADSLSLTALPAYRAMRRLCLRRLFTTLLPAPEPGADIPSDAVLGEALYDVLGQDAAAPGVVHGAALPQDWRLTAAKSCAVLMTRQGVASVTHRSVAALAGLKPTTVAYRYPAQEDLVIAGLEYIITHLLTSVETVEARKSGELLAPDPLEGLDVGRATFAVAVAAIRMTALAPCAADMRRRRGVNLLRLLQSRSPDYARMDRLTAQTLSVGMIGAAMFTPICEASRTSVEGLVEPARRWMTRGTPKAAGEGSPL